MLALGSGTGPGTGARLQQLIVLLLGIQGLITGIVLLIMAFQGGGWGSGIMGVLSIIFGLILVFNWYNPAMVVALVWVTAIFAIIGGIFQIV